MSETSETFVVINGVEIVVPTPPANAQTCSIDELQEYLNKQQHYEQQVADATAGKPRTDALYAMPMEELERRANEQYQAAEAKRIDEEQGRAGETFVKNEPSYIPNPENAQLLFDEVQRQGLPGSVYDLKRCFDQLVTSGKMQAKFIAPTVNLNPPTPEEIASLSMDDLKRLAEEQMQREESPIVNVGGYK